MNKGKLVLLTMGFVLLMTGVLGASGPLVVDFDHYQPGLIGGQDGWTSRYGHGMIQNTVTPDGTGYALEVLLPAELTKAFPELIGARQVEITFKPQLSDRDSKVVFYALDSAGRRAVLFFHDEGSRWGLQSGSDWVFVPNSLSPGLWIDLRLVIDYTKRTVSVYRGSGGQWTPLWTDRAFTHGDAEHFATFVIIRHPEQGSDTPVYFDQLQITAIGGEEMKDQVSVTTSRPRYSIFQPDEEVTLTFRVERQAYDRADLLEWEIKDFFGSRVLFGTLDLPAGLEIYEESLVLPRLRPGYYEIQATVKGSNSRLPKMGSRPAGIATFGVLPEVEPLRPVHRDDSRFGIQGTNFLDTGVFMLGDPYDPLYHLLGVRWVNHARSWRQLEPEFSGQYEPKLNRWEFLYPSYEAKNELSLLTCIDGLPYWAIAWPDPSTAPKSPAELTHPLSQAYPPLDYEQYSDFLAKVAAEDYVRRQTHFADMRHGYYQVHWEPDWHWKGTDEEFIQMYASAYEGLHRGDPEAVVMGPGYGVLDVAVEELARLLPAGLKDYLDGIAVHGYYWGQLQPESQPPEEGLIENLRKLRSLVDTYLGPEAKVFQTEWGLDYRTSYDLLTPEILDRQAAYSIRAHIIFLGEGMDITYLFYTADYSGESGYGLCFNLSMEEHNFGATAISPKPVAMAAATMTRVLEGTKTIGPLPLTDGLYAYLFARGDQYVCAAWSVNGPQEVTVNTDATVVEVIDFMGGRSVHQSPTGEYSLALDSYPLYVLSAAPIQIRP